MRLEDVRAGASVRGITPDGAAAEILNVERFHDAAIRVVYRDRGGALGDRLVYRHEEAALEPVQGGDAGEWTFDGDGALLRLVSEALRIRLAHLFDPYLAVHTSRIEPLPHQITAVYGEMLPRQPLRFLLADDPGAGKTIMTGLLIKELLVRGDLERCLVVAPGNLVEQWQDELATKFGLSFVILDRERAQAARLAGNPFDEEPLLIARLDTLSRGEDLKALLEGADPYDLVVVDEAHKMSASYTGGEVKYTGRYILGELLRERCRHFLLLSATPHSGKREDFELFMKLLDEDRFEGRARTGERADAGDLMRRVVKEELYTFDGRPLFPERRAYTTAYDLTPQEAALYDDVTEYVREEMNLAERFAEAGDDKRRINVGFALQILQRRLASSPQAIHRSLSRRRERLERRLAEEQAVAGPLGDQAPLFGRPEWGAVELPEYLIEEDLDDAPAEEFEREEERILDRATAAATIPELRKEIATLRRLEERARAVLRSGTDAKWDQLAEIIDDPLVTGGGPDGSLGDVEQRRKLIIFTEAKDTLSYLAGKIRTLRGRQEEVVEIHGGLSRDERRAAVEAFTHDPSVLFLVATDAAGEGVNLQKAHLMVNYDLPWNPNRLEQRFGRIHRIGQKEVCHLWNLVASETREGEVYSRLLEKLERAREDLGGRVYDVLGRLFEKRPLRDLLVEAIRYGEAPDVRARLSETVEEAVDRGRLEELLEERALAQETLAPGRVERVRERMERAEARRLQPHFVRAFFLEAFRQLGGTVRARDAGLYQITHVPRVVREVDRRIGRGTPVARAYERIFFEKERGEGLPPGAFVAPGHPLLEATIDLLIERHGGLLKRGAVLVDEADPSEGPEDVRALFYLEHAVQDGRAGRDGRQQVISRRLQFVETDPRGSFRDPGPAPYLDYRPLGDGERELLGEALDVSWLGSDAGAGAVGYAVGELVPGHVEEVARRRLPMIEKVEREVEARLKAQLNYWDRRAQELKEQERLGKKTRLSSRNAQTTAEELAVRLERRRSILGKERQISALPPVVRGGALVIPGGLARRMGGEDVASAGADPDVLSRQEIEKAAMAAVMEAERALGRIPKDVSDKRGIGHDIEAKDPETGSLCFVEVKGKWEGKDDVTLTKNEILCSRNEPEKFRLAVVVVGEGGATAPRYLRGYPFGEPDFAETTRTFSLRKLLDAAGPPA